MKLIAGILKLLYGLLWLFTAVSVFVAAFLLFDAGWTEFLEGIAMTASSAFITWLVHGLANWAEDRAADVSKAKSQMKESWKSWSRGKKPLLNLVGLWLTLSFSISLCIVAFAERLPQYALVVAVLAFLFFLFAMRKQEKLIHGSFGSGVRIFFRALGNTCATFFLGAVISMAAPLLGLTDRIINPSGDLPACSICCALLFLISNFRKDRALHFSHSSAAAVKPAAKKPAPAPVSGSIKSNLTQTDLLVAKLQANPSPAPIKTASTPLPKAASTPASKPTSSAPPVSKPVSTPAPTAAPVKSAASPAPKPVTAPPKPTPATAPVTKPVTAPITPVKIPNPEKPVSTPPKKKPTAAEISAKKRATYSTISKLLEENFRQYQVAENIPFDNIISEMWICGCGAENEGGFCGECGRAKNECSVWTCSCGSQNSTRFCTRCGKVKPREVPLEPIHFLVMQNGIPKLAILIVTRRRWNHKPIRATLESCDKAGIPWQRYFAEYDNEKGYVLDRIRNALL